MRDLAALILLSLLIHLSYADRVKDPLSDLRWHWGGAYLIEHPAPDEWTAQRRDGRGTLRADGPVLLREMITADYTARPAPRDLPGRPRGTRGPGPRFTCGD